MNVIILAAVIAGATWLLNHSMGKLCKRLDRLAAAWEKDDDDDDPSDSWKKEKV